MTIKQKWLPFKIEVSGKTILKHSYGNIHLCIE